MFVFTVPQQKIELTTRTLLPVPLLRIRKEIFDSEHIKPKRQSKSKLFDCSTDGCVMSDLGVVSEDSGFQETSPDFITLTTRKRKTNDFNNEQAAFGGLNTSFLNGEHCLCEFCVNSFINDFNTHYDYSYIKQGCTKCIYTYKSNYSYHVSIF